MSEGEGKGKERKAGEDETDRETVMTEGGEKGREGKRERETGVERGGTIAGFRSLVEDGKS